MNEGVGSQIAAGIAAIIGLAVLGVVVSNSANTVNVVSAFFGGVSNLIAVAISPITGATVQGNAGGIGGGSWAGGAQSGFSLNPASFLSGAAGGLGIGSGLGGLGSVLGGFVGGGGLGGGGLGGGGLGDIFGGSSSSGSGVGSLASGGSTFGSLDGAGLY